MLFGIPRSCGIPFHVRKIVPSSASKRKSRSCVVQAGAVLAGDQEKLHALPAYAVDSLLLEVDVHPEPLELPNCGQERHSVPRESGDELRQDEVKLPGPGVRHHPLQSRPLLLYAGEDFVRVDPRVFSCWFAWIREL